MEYVIKPVFCNVCGAGHIAGIASCIARIGANAQPRIFHIKLSQYQGILCCFSVNDNSEAHTHFPISAFFNVFNIFSIAQELEGHRILVLHLSQPSFKGSDF